MNMIQEMMDWYRNHKLAKVFTATLGAAALLPSVAEAEGVEITGQMEVFGGLEGSTLDTKVNANIGRGVSAFGRNTTAIQYDPVAASPFTLVNAGYSPIKEPQVRELRFFAEADMSSAIGVVPRVGGQYFESVVVGSGDLGLLGLATVACQEHPDLFLLADARYTHPITDNLDFTAELETKTSFDADGLVFANQFLQLGVGFNGLGGGIGVYHSDGQFNPGLYVELR